jgi:hypothetical protein
MGRATALQFESQEPLLNIQADMRTHYMVHAAGC